MRVPGQTGQESSYEAQEAELRAGAPGEVAKVYKDKASGPREHRPGQSRLAAAGQFDVVAVARKDRPSRSGTTWTCGPLERDGVAAPVLCDKGSAGGADELLADFMAPMSSFAGRLYGVRSREARARPAAAARATPEGPCWPPPPPAQRSVAPTRPRARCWARPGWQDAWAGPPTWWPR